MTDWLSDKPTDRQTNWLNYWLPNSLTEWLTKWIIGWLTDWLNEWMTDRMNEWQTDWLIDWLTDRQTDKQTDWLTDRHTDCQTDRLIKSLTEWVMMNQMSYWLMHCLRVLCTNREVYLINLWINNLVIDWLSDWCLSNHQGLADDWLEN